MITPPPPVRALGRVLEQSFGACLEKAVDTKHAYELLGSALDEPIEEAYGLRRLKLPHDCSSDGEGYIVHYGAFVVRDADGLLWSIDLRSFDIASGEEHRVHELPDPLEVPAASWKFFCRDLAGTERDAATIQARLIARARGLGLPELAERLAGPAVSASIAALLDDDLLRVQPSLDREIASDLVRTRAIELGRELPPAALDALLGQVVGAPYDRASQYAVGDLVDHAKLGRGVVIATETGRVVVQFEAGARALQSG